MSLPKPRFETKRTHRTPVKIQDAAQVVSLNKARRGKRHHPLTAGEVWQALHDERKRLDLDADGDAAARLADLVNRGFRVMLDDIGVGYASLNCIPRLPLSGFKLDRFLIAGPASYPKA